MRPYFGVSCLVLSTLHVKREVLVLSQSDSHKLSILMHSVKDANYNSKSMVHLKKKSCISKRMPFYIQPYYIYILPHLLVTQMHSTVDILYTDTPELSLSTFNKPVPGLRHHSFDLTKIYNRNKWPGMIETEHLSHPKCMYYSCMYCSKDTSSAPFGVWIRGSTPTYTCSTRHIVTHKQTHTHRSLQT